MNSVWDKYHEKLIKKWAETSKTYSIMHSLCAQHYSRWHKRLGVPVIILGGLASSSIFSNNHNDPAKTEFWNYINGGITLSMTALAGMTNFLSLEEKTSTHQNASYKYLKIALDIDTLLSFSRNKRSISPEEFIRTTKSQILGIREDTPEVLTWIMSEYLNQFNTSLTNTSSSINNKDISSNEQPSLRDESKNDSLSEISSIDIKISSSCDKILSDFNDDDTNKVYQACEHLKSLSKVINYSSESESDDDNPKEQF
jgi:hypothetical protein